MSRVSTHRPLVRAAARSAYALGAGVVTVGLGIGVLRAEAELAKRVIGNSPGPGWSDQGRYGAGYGTEIHLLMLGDSTAAGVGAGSPQQTVGAVVASSVAAFTGRPVQLTNVSRSGATSPQLRSQVGTGLAATPAPDVALIMIGANDVKERLDRDECARALGETVAALRATGAEVIVGTCPDLGTIRPIPQPLRRLVEHWSRGLAAAQTVATVEAGGRTVSTGDLLGPHFREHHEHLFSDDRFHPSAAGYARAAAALLPSVLDSLGVLTVDSGRSPDRHRREGVGPLPEAARAAAHDPGSEVSASDTPGLGRARWAQVLRRQRQPLPQPPADGDQPSASSTET